MTAPDPREAVVGHFRRKPVVIEARRLTENNAGEVARWCFGNVRGGPEGGSRGGSVLIYTLEGRMEASPGDWVIESVRGEFYPCKPDIFEETYERALDATTIDPDTTDPADGLSEAERRNLEAYGVTPYVVIYVDRLLRDRAARQRPTRQVDTGPADALSQRVVALLDECRCTLQYPGFDRAPFTNDASCPAHATDYTGLKRRLRALLAARQEGASK